jgi:hypothetical protein
MLDRYVQKGKVRQLQNTRPSCTTCYPCFKCQSLEKEMYEWIE